MSRHISSDHSRSASRSSQNPRLSQGQYESVSRQSFGRSSRVSNPNVFSDEYSLEPIYVDQIERSASPISIASADTFTQPTPKPAGATAAETNDDPFADEARSSIDESHRSSLPQKGGFANNRNSVTSLNNPTFAVQRNQSVSSRFSIPRALSPYTGATGPSHPYSMYPQVGVSRSASIGSTSTIRPIDRPLGENSGPQHPYGMYSQNVVEEGIDDEIPVGFPGLNSQYQPPPSRRIDDVGDIIGPDGHTEPLPPYSRYPTGAVPKPAGVEMETMNDMNNPVVDINLPPQEERQLSSTSREQPISNTSSRALIPQTSTNSEPNAAPVVAGATAATGATGIMAFEEKLKRKGKQKVCCGLPVWTIVLIATVMLIGGSIGGVIGGVLGTRKAQEADRKAQQAQQQQQSPHIVTVTASAQLDYSSITTTNTNYTPVPTGHFLIPSVLQNYSRMCVEDHDIKEVWSCLEEPKDFEVYVGNMDGQQSIVFASDDTTATSTFSYGAQQPILPTPTQNLSMVMDTSDTGLGPALFFWSYVDKLVILPESALDSSSASKKRDVSEDILASYMERKEAVQSGDKPWFCWWNQTVLEFFLYVNQSAHDASFSSTPIANGNLAASMATAQAKAKRDDDVANYPRIIKMEERRDDAGAASPYCQQMQLESNGHIQAIPNKVVSVQEVQPTPTTTYTNTASGSGQTYTAKATWATPCYCLSLSD
ncbi:hypothetical protein N7466_008997 [Penicillium verhagenii]|uniref:uncharacterized protein n=1 Tax=Penicillium verhagenii TaxID=1562060 RepID=UPI0025450D62|nr:uncharacterized protein N7466_008997 [Penicillium verhagenii]KAJ5924810.1 hypothetical protein N7466_008997 [Penicillium verhagenii]